MMRYRQRSESLTRSSAHPHSCESPTLQELDHCTSCFIVAPSRTCLRINGEGDEQPSDHLAIGSGDDRQTGYNCLFKSDFEKNILKIQKPATSLAFEAVCPTSVHTSRAFLLLSYYLK